MSFSYSLQWLKTCAVRFQVSLYSRRLNGIFILIKHVTQSYILLRSFYFDNFRLSHG